jgi:hypothetical protein
VPEPENPITIGEDGEVVVPDSFWDDISEAPKAPEPAKPEPVQPEPAPAYYTPEEFAAAFASGAVDEAKLRPEVAEFYKAAVKQGAAQAPAPVPQAPAPTPATQAPAAMTPAQYAQLREAAKKVAARNYLGIDPAEFDEMDPSHAEAQRFAMGQIQARAREIASARADEAARANMLAAEIGSLDAEYRRKDPEFFAKHEALMLDYMERLPYKSGAEAMRAIQTGDVAGIKKFLDGVYQDYKKQSAPVTAPVAPAAKTPPPAVMTASGSSEGVSAGLADAEELADMSDEERAEWLIRHKFAI